MQSTKSIVRAAFVRNFSTPTVQSLVQLALPSNGQYMKWMVRLMARSRILCKSQNPHRKTLHGKKIEWFEIRNCVLKNYKSIYTINDILPMEKKKNYNSNNNNDDDDGMQSIPTYRIEKCQQSV